MREKNAAYDVVIAGGGIAGAALAASLARGKLEVLLLEASETYPDPVRGEAMVQWGVAEAKRLGLLETLVKAGGHTIGRMIGYDEVMPPDAVEAAPVDMSQFLEGVPGLLSIRHPEHCQALLDAAISAGANVERGVQVVSAEAGPKPTVVYRRGSEEVTARAAFLVGADGRASTMRESFGAHLDSTKPRDIFAGLLVEDAHGWDESAWTVGTEGALCFAVFPMGKGRARIYASWSVADRNRFSGAQAPRDLLAAFDLSCCPASRAIATARAAGPFRAFLNNESWVDQPAVEGGVLVGDAAGWTDPITGCGLSSAYRDARMVSEILIASRDRSPRAFEPYAEERKERLRRLRSISAIMTGLACEFGEIGRARRRRWFEKSPNDPRFLAHLAANMAGPETMPAEIFTPEHRAYVLDER